MVESPEYRPLSIKSSEMTLLAKWELVEEKAGSKFNKDTLGTHVISHVRLLKIFKFRAKLAKRKRICREINLAADIYGAA